ncbi:MAG: methyl-accepting chemotaxis protein [Prolixibacteraceae bacterium]|nr:methyl-accepting chemotaxis protein [Prolixibacteraceae bacterium]
MNYRGRFILLFAIIFITFTLIGVYTFFSFKKIKRISEIDKKVQHLKSLALELKNHEYNFIGWDLISPGYFKNGQSINLQNFNNTYREAIQICSELGNEPFISTADTRNNVAEINTKLIEYNKRFIKFQEEKKAFGFKDWGLVGNMRDAIHHVENETNKMGLDKLKIHMLMLRRHEKDYLLRRDLSYRVKFQNEYTNFKNSLRKAAISDNKKTELLGLLNNYHDTFITIIEKDNVIGITQKEGYSKLMNRSSEELIGLVSGLSNLISAKTNRYINRAILLLILFIVVCTSAALAIGLFMMKGIRNIMGGSPEEVALIAENVAKGRLRMNLDSSKAYQGMMKSVVIMTEKLIAIISGIHENAEKLAGTSRLFTSSSQHISNGAYNQAASIDEISSTIEEIGQNIKQNTHNAHETNKLAGLVKINIHKIEQQTDRTLESVKAIDEKIKIINTIANQTTILALNAAVEAARAGENGKGFHIISEEVKRLAQISKEAASEINGYAAQNIQQAKDVTQMVKNILIPVEETTNYVKSITHASEEMEAGTNQIINSINELYSISQENAASSQEMAASSTDLEKQAHSLIKTVSYFHLDEKAKINIKKKKKKNKENPAEDFTRFLKPEKNRV